MNHGGDAAEQIVRMSLQGVEVAARVTGTAAKEIALLLIAALKNDDKDHTKLRGKERLNTMLKSGKPLEIFSVKESYLQKFAESAKEYGIVYCVLRNAKNCPDGLCDIMVKADDAPKISRLIERFDFATVDKARIESEIIADMAARAAPDMPTTEGLPFDAEPEAPDRNDIEKLLDDLMGTDEGKIAPDTPELEKTEPPGKEQLDSLPFGTPDPKLLPSEPTLNSGKKSEKAILNEEFEIGSRADSERTDNVIQDVLASPVPDLDSKKSNAKVTLNKQSVKRELREITAAQQVREADMRRRDERLVADRPKDAPAVTRHRQQQRKRKSKTKSKGSR